MYLLRRGSRPLDTMTYATCAEQTMFVVVFPVNLSQVNLMLSKGEGPW